MPDRTIGLELARRHAREWLDYRFDEQSAAATGALIGNHEDRPQAASDADTASRWAGLSDPGSRVIGCETPVPGCSFEE